MTPQIFELETGQATIYVVALTSTSTPHGAFPTREEAEAFLLTLE